MIEGGGATAVMPGEMLFGRSSELAQLELALGGAVLGRGGLVCLKGEPGIGKTRLVTEVTRLATQRGCATHRGRTWEGGGAPPMWPWTQVLQSLVQTFPNELALRSKEALFWLLDPFAQSEVTETAPLPDGEAQRFAWMVNLTQVIEGASRDTPLLLIFEDLHAADLATLRTLHFAAGELRGKRVLILVTYRNHDARSSEEATELLARVEREGTVLYLDRLDRTAVASWMRRQLGNVDGALGETVFSATMGNPLFVDEVLRLLSTRADPPGSGDHVPIPYGIRQAIRQRLAGVSPNGRALLDIAAIVGVDVDVDLIGDLARRGNLASHDGTTLALEDGLREVELHQMLIPNGPRSRRFSHALIHEVLNRDLPPGRRAELHLMVAESLEARIHPPAAEIVHHLMEAEEFPSDAARLVAWTLRASEHHSQLLAHEDSIALLERVRAVVERRNEPLQLAEVLLALSDSWTRIGRIAQARAVCSIVGDIARREKNHSLLAHAALAYGHEFDFGAVDPRLVSLLEEALGCLEPSDVDLRARCLARLAAARQPSEDPSEMVAMAREAIALARTTKDDGVLLAVLHSALGAMMDYADPRERFALNSEQLELSRARSDLARELRAHQRLLLDCIELGDWARLKGHAANFEAIVRSLRQTRLLPTALTNFSMIALAAGDFAQSQSLIDEATPLWHPEDPMYRWRHSHGGHGAGRTKERWAEVDAALEALAREWGHEPVWEFFGPLVYANNATRAERRDDAAYWFAQIAPVPVLQQDISTSVMIMETTAYVGSPEQRRELLESALPRRGRLVSWGMVGQLCDGPIDRVLALLAASIDDWDAAEEYFASAERQAAALGFRPVLARTLYERARERMRRGRNDDRDAAASDLARARALAEELPLPDLLTLIEKRLPALGAIEASSDHVRAMGTHEPTRVASAENAAATFDLRRQGEFWRVLFQGTELHLRDTRGLRLLARLVEQPGKELHVLDLGSGGVPERAAIDQGDVSPLLDEKARLEYRRRLVELDEMLEEAESMGDIGRAERAREEREFLALELSRAVGLGGRDRKSRATSERARVAVTRRLRDAIQRIAQKSPSLGRHLERSIRTGTYCVYMPE